MSRSATPCFAHSFPAIIEVVSNLSEVLVAKSLVIDYPNDLPKLRLPAAVQARLNSLLDKQDEGNPLTDEERDEAEGLVSLAETLSFLKLRAERTGP